MGRNARAAKDSATIEDAEARRLQRESEKALAALGVPQAPAPVKRVAVAGPSNSTLEEEMWRLRRLYSATSDFSIQEGQSEQQLRFTHHCADPDWEAENWAANGLQLEVVIPSSYPSDLTCPELKVLGPSDLPSRFAETLPLLFAESLAKATPGSPAVYRALQHVDRFLAPLWRKVQAIEEKREAAEREAEQAEQARAAQVLSQASHEASQEETNPKDATSKGAETKMHPWSPEEQACLEAAIVEFRGEANMKRRWNLIAQKIGGNRSARECAERFRACRDFALGKTASPDAAADETETLQGSVSVVPASAWSAAEVRRLGVEVRLIGLTLEGFATMLPRVLRLQIVCSRCRKPVDVESPEGGAEARTAELACPTCKQELAVRIAPSICHGGCAALAHVLGVNCHPTQLLRSDVDATCGECTAVARVRSVGPGYKKRADCAKCHAKLNMIIEGAELLGHAVAHWRHVAAEEGDRVSARRQLQEARRLEREQGIQAGQPLPNNGQCKHFSKSYRWLRFPCCGRAFPCPVCHDEKSDHPHEWANRMLCGHCSHEQPFSKDQCTKCGAAQTRSKTAYWEGGDGNRNRVTMARNDPHKYKGLGKTVSCKK